MAKKNLGNADLVTAISADDTIFIESGGSVRRAPLSSISSPYLEEEVAYGIRRNIADSSYACTRIGNMSLHKTLPVQSLMRGCILDDSGDVVEYLPSDSWVGAATDGSKGQVMVELPQYYRKCAFYDDGTMEVWLSLYPLAGYDLISKVYVGAYQAALERSTLKLCSVVNGGEDYRGGNNNAAYDGTYCSQLGKPASSISSNNFLAYARNRGTAGKNGYGWTSYLYEAHKTITWLFAVEYATLHTQATYNAELTSEGYHQGGLGAGATNLTSNRWQNFMGGGRYAFLDCGYTDEYGNGTGVKSYTMPFQYDAADNSSTSGDIYYVGEYDSGTAYSSGDYVSDGELLYTCIADAPAGTALTDTSYFSSVTRTTTNVTRYRGVELPYGQLYLLPCDILVNVHPSEESGGDGLSPIYTCQDPSKFTGSSYDDYTFIGNFLRSSGYVTEIIFGSKGEIVGKTGGGTSSTYYCDQNHTSSDVTSNTMRMCALGGSAYSGSNAGLFCAFSSYAPSSPPVYCGSRLCFIPA